MLSDFLRVGVLTSRRAPGLETLLHHPFRGTLYEIDCVITSDPAFPDCGVPVITHPIRTFYDERNAELCDRDIRAEYDAATAAMLHHLGVNTLLLIGYLYLVTDPLLNDFGDHILNVHDGVSRYPGLHSTLRH